MEELAHNWPQFTAWAKVNLPRVGLALGLLVAGYLVASLLRFVSAKLLGRWSVWALRAFERVSGRRDPDSHSQRIEASSAAARLTSRVIFWLVFALFVAAATSVLGMAVVSTWFAGLAAYLPRIMAAVAIVLLGVLVGHIARVTSSAAAGTAGIRHAQSLGRLSQTIIVFIACVVAIEGLGLEISFLVVLAAVILGSSLGAVALAFGLGARTHVNNLVACHYVARTYRVGHRVRIGEAEGHIVAIGPDSVVLRTREGRLLVPAHHFSLGTSLLLTDEEAAADEPKATLA